MNAPVGAELAIPVDVARATPLEELIAEQHHLPAWFIEAWKDRCHRLAGDDKLAAFNLSKTASKRGKAGAR